MKLYTKTFCEHQWFQIKITDAGVDFEPLETDSPTSIPLDDQCRAWVDATNNEIVHPGQIGMHKEQFNDRTLLCLTLAVTVLYKQAAT
jgi:hypothetical protein